MSFQSILFANIEDRSKWEITAPPDYFVDLNLDQVVAAITNRKEEYNLKPFFYAPLKDVDAIHFRQEVTRDLEDSTLLQNIKSFAEKMSIVRRYLNMVNKLEYKHHKEGWYLEAALKYCDAVKCLAEDLAAANLSSRGFIEFREFVKGYVQSARYLSLAEAARIQKEKLSSIRYCILTLGNWVRVRKYESEIDYSVEVEKTFEKFKQGQVKNYRVDLLVASGMNHVEAQILEGVAKLFPDIFAELDQFFERYKDFSDYTIFTFDREIQFYVAYLDFIAAIKESGLKFCFPELTVEKKEIHAHAAFDIALANKRIYEKSTVVPNDFYLRDPERIIIVSGPNQGGKTTFARMFGQIHYLASLGLPVPGRDARLFLFDRIYTHFETEENIRNLRGKLQDDLVRLRVILERATADSIIIMNEIFTSTALKDAIFLSKQIMQRIIQLNALCVCVSFIDELSTLSEQTVSMVSTVVPDNPSERTFKIIRKPADGLSFAICIAEKHGLTYDRIKERIAQ